MMAAPSSLALPPDVAPGCGFTFRWPAGCGGGDCDYIASHRLHPDGRLQFAVGRKVALLLEKLRRVRSAGLRRGRGRACGRAWGWGTATGP